jgi:hypothetical protein
MGDEDYSTCGEYNLNTRDINNCKARIDLFNHLRFNPDLKKFIINDEIISNLLPDYDSEIIYDPETQEPTSIKIPTNNAGSLMMKPRTAYTTNNSTITFNIIKKYTLEESENIYKVIYNENQNCYSNFCRAGNGSDIIFDDDGNLKLDINGDGLNTVIYYNPNLDNWKKIEIKDKKTKNNSLDAESTAYNWIAGDIWDISQKFFMNHAGTFIVYTPFKKEKLTNRTPPQSIVYYLLSNPIHTYDFAKFYMLLSEIKKPSEDFDRKIYYTTNYGYMESTEEVQLWGNNSLQESANTFRIPSYKTIISKYCNAFKIETSYLHNLNRIKSQIYLDPVCSIAIDKNTSELSFTLGKNYTQECLSYDFWKKDTSITDDEKLEDYKAGIKDLNYRPGLIEGTVTDTTPRWGCINHVSTSQQETALTWLQIVSKHFTENSSSFFNVLANSYINTSNNLFVDEQNQQSINFEFNKKINPPDCNLLKTPDTIICSSIIETGSNINFEGNIFNFKTACGLNQPESPNTDPNTDPDPDPNPDPNPNPDPDPNTNPNTNPTPPQEVFPNILTFKYLYNDYLKLIVSVEHGTGLITATPPLTDLQDIEELKKVITSNKIITIMHPISQDTTFKLTVKDDDENEVSRELEVLKKDILKPDDIPTTNLLSNPIIIILIILIIIALIFFLIKK